MMPGGSEKKRVTYTWMIYHHQSKLSGGFKDFLGWFLLRILGKWSNLMICLNGQPPTIVSDCRYSVFAAFPSRDSILFISQIPTIGLGIATHPGKKNTDAPPKLHTPNVADPFEGLRQVDGLIAMEESVQLGVRLFLRCPHGKVETSRRGRWKATETVGEVLLLKWKMVESIHNTTAE